MLEECIGCALQAMIDVHGAHVQSGRQRGTSGKLREGRRQAARIQAATQADHQARSRSRQPPFERGAE